MCYLLIRITFHNTPYASEELSHSIEINSQKCAIYLLNFTLKKLIIVMRTCTRLQEAFQQTVLLLADIFLH